MARHRNKSSSYPAKAGNQKPANGNDFLSGDPGSTATRRLPAMQAPAGDLPEIEATAEDLPGTRNRAMVCLPRDVVRVLLLASDSACERLRAGNFDTTNADLDFLASLASGKLVDSVTLRPTEKLETAIAAAGQVVGIGRDVEAGPSPADSYFADVEAAERKLVASVTLPAAGSFSAG
jgi:hypothetical protein